MDRNLVQTGYWPTLCLLALTLMTLATVEAQGGGRDATIVPTTLMNGTFGGRKVSVCALQTCRIRLFRRFCSVSRVGFCPQRSHPKATKCCYTGCCEPEHTYLSGILGKFWVVFAIIFAVGMLSVARYWYEKRQLGCCGHYLGQGNRNTSARTAANTVTQSSANAGATATGPLGEPVSLYGGPPAYNDALSFPKVEGEFSDVLPKYDELSLHNTAAATTAEPVLDTVELTMHDEAASIERRSRNDEHEVMI